MDVYLGFDVGTTSIKAIAVDGEGAVLASIRIPCKMESPKPGYFEIESISQWRGGFLEAVKSLGEDIVSNTRAICVSSVCASFVPVDAGGRPLRNAILYGIDTRASTQISRLNREIDGELLPRVAGSGFTSHSVLPKLMWLKENEPDVYERTALFVESSNFITSYLTGRYAWDRPTAAGGHMLDVSTGDYPAEFLEKIGIDGKKLPRLKYPLETLGMVSAEASSSTGIPAGASVLVGACDVNAEAFACGAFDPGSLLLVFGSTVSTLFTTKEFKFLPGFLLGPSILAGTYRLGGATSSGGRFLDWIASLFEKDAESGFEFSEKDPSPSGLLMVPFLDGARVPHQNPEFRVLWYGMKSGTTYAEIRKAAMEAMGCELHQIIEMFSSVEKVPEFIHVAGGLASNSGFLRLAADISGKTLKRFTRVNAAYGDCLMALASEKGLAKVREIVAKRSLDEDEVEVFEPNEAVYRAYEGKRRLYNSAVEWIRGLP